MPTLVSDVTQTGERGSFTSGSLALMPALTLALVLAPGDSISTRLLDAEQADDVVFLSSPPSLTWT